jgi:hypothetical protein
MFDWLRWLLIPKEIKFCFPKQLKLLEANDRVILRELGYDYRERQRIEDELRERGLTLQSTYSRVEEVTCYKFFRKGERLIVREVRMYRAKRQIPLPGTLAADVRDIKEDVDKILRKLDQTTQAKSDVGIQ